MATISSDVTQNWTALTYANGDLIRARRGSTLTIDASITGTIPDRIQSQEPGTVVHIINTSTSTPIVINAGVTGNTQMDAINGGKILIEGAKISLGTGSGVAGQTFTLPTTDTGANMPRIGGIFSEQGDTLRDGTVVPRLHALADATTYSVIIDHDKAGNVYTQDTTANTVTFKRAIPSGVNVYIPNIFIANGSSGGSSGQISTNISGSIGGHDFGLTDAYLYISRMWEEVVLDHVVATTQKTTAMLQFQQAAYRMTLTNAVLIEDMAGTWTSDATYTNPAAPGADIRNAWVNSCRSNAVELSAPGNYLENVVVTNSNPGTISSYYALNLQNNRDNVLRDLIITAPTTSAFVQNCANLDIDGLEVCAGFRSDSTSTYSPNLMTILYGTGIRVTNVEEMDDTTVGLTPRRNNNAVSTSYVQDLFINNVTLRSAPAGDNTKNWAGVVSTQGLNNTYQNFTVYGQIRNRAIYATDAVEKTTYRNIYYADAQTVNTSSRSIFGTDSVVDRVSAGHSSTAIVDTQPAVEMFDVGSYLLYRNGDTDKTAGAFVQYINPSRTDPRTVFAGSTTSKLEYSRGLAYLRTDPGVDVVITSDVHTGVVGCTDASIALGSLSATTDFEVRRREGAWSTPATFNATNINSAIAALPSAADNEVQFRFTLSSITGTNDSAYIGKVELDLTLDGRVSESATVNFDPDSPWNRPLVDHQQAGSFGELVQQIHTAATSAASSRATT